MSSHQSLVLTILVLTITRKTTNISANRMTQTINVIMIGCRFSLPLVGGTVAGTISVILLDYWSFLYEFETDLVTRTKSRRWEEQEQSLPYELLVA